MLYYLSTTEREAINDLFTEHMERLTENIDSFIHSDLPEELANNEYAKMRFHDLHVSMEMAISDLDEDIEKPMLFCGMNRKKLVWNKFFGLPHGKEIVIVDEDGDTYTFDEFNEIAGETCELTKYDEKMLKRIRASQFRQESDGWEMVLGRNDD